jgi:hypothetical protein
VASQSLGGEYTHICRMLGRRSPIGRREYTPRGMSLRVSVVVCFRAPWDRLAVSLQG